MTSTLSRPRRRSAVRAIGGIGLATALLVGAAPSAWSEPSTEAVDAINSRYTTFGGEASLLGLPLAEAVDVPGGAVRDYAGGAIYYSETSGARVMYGAILDRYRALGGPGGELGFPTNDESDTGDGVGRFNDFASPGGAALYWTPQWGASLVKGRVLEAWRQSGGVTGPFGYPTADTTVLDGVQTGKFIGPGGTEIQWSQAGGLVTIPAELAAAIPGFAATAPEPALTSAAPPTATATTPRTTSASPATSGVFTDLKGKISRHWWLIPAGLGALAILAALVRLLRRRPAASRSVTAPAKVSAKPAAPARAVPERITPTADPEPPTTRIELPPRETGLGMVRPVPPRPVPPPPIPAPPKPAPPPPAPRPIAEQPRPLMSDPPPPWAQRSQQPAPQQPAPQQPAPQQPAPPAAPVPFQGTPAPIEIRREPAGEDLSPVIRYQAHEPADAAIEVTYQNNALGEHQASAADKSDSIPD